MHHFVPVDQDRYPVLAGQLPYLGPLATGEGDPAGLEVDPGPLQAPGDLSAGADEVGGGRTPEQDDPPGPDPPFPTVVRFFFRADRAHALIVAPEVGQSVV